MTTAKTTERHGTWRRILGSGPLLWVLSAALGPLGLRHRDHGEPVQDVRRRRRARRIGRRALPTAALALDVLRSRPPRRGGQARRAGLLHPAPERPVRPGRRHPRRRAVLHGSAHRIPDDRSARRRLPRRLGPARALGLHGQHRRRPWQHRLLDEGYLPEPTGNQVQIFTILSWTGLIVIAAAGGVFLVLLLRRRAAEHV